MHRLIANLNVQTTEDWSYARAVCVLSTLVFLSVWVDPFSPVGVGLKGYAPLHSILEIVAVAIATAIFIIGWHGRLVQTTMSVAILACGFLGVALLDVGHILSFKGMPDWVTPSGAGKAIHFWFVARYLAAFTIINFIFFQSSGSIRRGMEWFVLAGVLAISSITFWVVLTHEALLPTFLIPGVGLTGSKIAAEWGLIGLNVIAMYMVLRRRNRAAYYSSRHLFVALWLGSLGELCFTLYSSASDIFNLLGHLFKVFSYVYIYKSIVTSLIRVPYKLSIQTLGILRDLTDNIRQFFWLKDIESQRLLFASPAYEHIWMRRCATIVDKPECFLDSVRPDFRQKVLEMWKSDQGDPLNLEFPIVRPDGEERWIRASTFPICDEGGTAFRIAGIADDITDDIQRERRQRENDRLLQQTQSIAHLGSWEFDVRFNKLSWSDEVYRIFGYEPNAFEPTMTEFLDRVHDDDREDVEGRYWGSIETGQAGYETEHRVVLPVSGNIRYVHEKCYHVRDNAGRIIKSTGIIHDITERKLAEFALKQQRDLDQRYLDTVQSLVVSLDCDGRIMRINRRGCEVLGYYEAEILGRKWSKFSFDSTLAPLLENIAGKNRHKGIHLDEAYSENMMICRDGRSRLIAWDHVKLVNVDGTIEGTLSSGVDITDTRQLEIERVRLQKQLAQSQKMEALGKLTSGIAHDFNNILGTVLGYTELTLDLYGDKVPEKGRAYLEQVKKSGERARDIIVRMLAFARGTKIEMQTIHPAEVVADVEQLASSLLPEDVEFRLVISGDPPALQADPTALGQIIANLLTNAKDAFERAGKITCEISHETNIEFVCSSCHQNASGEYVRIAIKDNGSGMSRETLDRIFEPFFTTKGVDKGTGLGLPMVHGLIHAFGGHLRLDSARGSGTTIHLYFPVMSQKTTFQTVVVDSYQTSREHV